MHENEVALPFAMGPWGMRTTRATDLDLLEAPPERQEDEGALPAYLHIAQTLAERLNSGVYAAGSRLPSGSELQAEFGVSPMTVRRALSLLEQQGLVTGVKGRSE